MQEVRNYNWSGLMVNITPSHQAYRRLAKAFKTEGYVLSPALRKSDNTIAFDDREKAECLTDIIEQQCSDNPSHDLKHIACLKARDIHKVEEEVRHRVSLLPEDDLVGVTRRRHLQAGLAASDEDVKAVSYRHGSRKISGGFYSVRVGHGPCARAFGLPITGFYPPSPTQGKKYKKNRSSQSSSYSNSRCALETKYMDMLVTAAYTRPN
ncbi:hypothetical protein EVAR_30327_1 [Eumeta japonica]|uniref:Uncharacterized protein n=1 Tax=Eumeta variegata TaxID=151549 RepID=A0A4C1W996_EUMVA|nr:hypothetical protein EVAR_30327_1 [Eumeta japonica]